MQFFPEIIVWIFLFIAILTIAMERKVWLVFFFLSIASALLLEILEITGVMIVLAGISIAYYATKQVGWRLYLVHSLLIIWAILLATHQLPGFNNLNVIEQAVTGANSVPFSMSLNIDKPMLIFAFILLLPGMLVKPPSGNRNIYVVLSVVSLISLPLLGCLMGLIKPEISVPSWIILFGLNNLLITCVSEEVFFRGYLQTIFSRYGQAVALAGSSLLFGLAHFAGGIELIILATVAGACYGLIYLATGRLYMAVAAHFSFNLYHLIFYTFPFASST
ncbi:CPBP family intramembrane metalloprotease [Motiliproteus coralliicola]|uniref:CPBP family intramembrane metalloprotease n=1 Tax=Motiliproteus coralliicola TaxID=2283196 RepID=A0A369WTZ3_9GAMM|nr:CPBP family intramembrane glutamic endopeptidase [Motiliproteus coralliicola]RDE24034.1 CPBP family intramembrane metalloprotease [Motiliproteus coralliicola]